MYDDVKFREVVKIVSSDKGRKKLASIGIYPTCLSRSPSFVSVDATMDCRLNIDLLEKFINKED